MIEQRSITLPPLISSKMIAFIRSHQKNNLIRTILITSSITSIFLLITGVLFFYSNTVRVFEYYSIGTTHPDRFELTKTGWLLSLLGKKDAHIDKTTLEHISKDSNIDRWYAFSLVELPVVVKVGLFQFSLETDIPIFSVSDSYFCKEKSPCDFSQNPPIGISRSLFDFYNSQLAGTADFFPRFPEWLIRGQKMEFTFGKSKIFEYTMKTGATIIGSVRVIENDLPGFWLTLPESVVQKQLASLWYRHEQPYKVVGYKKEGISPDVIRNSYVSLWNTVRFDTDKLEQIHAKLAFYRQVLFLWNSTIIAFFTLLLLFLFSWLIRELKPFLDYQRQLGLSPIRIFLFIEGYASILAGYGLTLWIGLLCFLQYFTPLLQKNMEKIGIGVPLLPIWYGEIWMVSMLIFWVISLIFFLLSFRLIGKKWENL